MKHVSDLVMAVGICIFILGTCCIDSSGMYGIIAAGACVLGGAVAGISYLAERKLERCRKKRICDFQQMDRLDADIEFIEEGGMTEE